MQKLLFALLCAAPALACAQALEITEQRNAAVGFAITFALTVDKVAGACSQLPAPDGQATEAAYGNWRQRNQPVIQATQGWLRQLGATLSASDGEEQAQASVKKIVLDLGAQADQAVADIFKQGAAEQVECQHWASVMADPSVDLLEHKEFGQDLREIMASLEASPRE